MILFKHNDILIPVAKVENIEQYAGGNRSKGWDSPTLKTLKSKKKLKQFLARGDAGQFIDCGQAAIENGPLGLIIQPIDYYDIDGKEFYIEV